MTDCVHRNGQETVVVVIPGNPAPIVDARGIRVGSAWSIQLRYNTFRAHEPALLASVAVGVPTNHCPSSVHGDGSGDVCARSINDREGAIAVAHETVLRALIFVVVKSRDLPCRVDTGGGRVVATGFQRRGVPGPGSDERGEAAIARSQEGAANIVRVIVIARRRSCGIDTDWNGELRARNSKSCQCAVARPHKASIAPTEPRKNLRSSPHR